MKHTRGGFPVDADRDQARRVAVAEYRELGGTVDEPLVEFVVHPAEDPDGVDELVVVVRSAPAPEPVRPPEIPEHLVILPGDLPPELYDQLSGFLNRSPRKLG